MSYERNFAATAEDGTCVVIIDGKSNFCEVLVFACRLRDWLDASIANEVSLLRVTGEMTPHDLEVDAADSGLETKDCVDLGETVLHDVGLIVIAAEGKAWF